VTRRHYAHLTCKLRGKRGSCYHLGLVVHAIGC
jgi:hypothetical protein